MLARLKPLAPIAAFAGGIGLLLYYALFIAHTSGTGGWRPLGSPLDEMESLSHLLSSVALALAVLGLAARLDGGDAVLSRIGAVFAGLALTACAIMLVLSLADTGMPRLITFMADRGLLLGALLVGIAVLRTRVLPRAVGVALLAYAPGTELLKLALGALEGMTGLPLFPAQLVAAALVWLYIALRLRRERVSLAAPAA